MASGRGRTAAAEPDSDEDDYVFYGTKLYDEEGLATGTVPTGSRPDPATTRSLPVHQQVATDEQGRKRFHGAFTGGFSAGYYNTVGSKEGWAPSSFTSSRAAPAARKAQAVEDFLDEDELEERRQQGPTLTATYDTFGSSAAAAAAADAAAAAAERPSAIPGAVPLEFFAPVSSSIGVQLLQKMGWRQGKGIGSKGAGSTAAAAAGGSKPRAQKAAAARPGLIDEDGSLFGGLAELAGFRSRAGGPHTAGSDSDDGADGGHHGQAAGSSKWGAVSGVSIENTPLYVLEPKQDLHGLGFDPFEGAEEFRSRKRQKLDAARAATGGLSHHAAAPGGGGFGGGGGRGRGAAAGGAGGGGRARGIAFGTGALEESDILGCVEDYIDADADVMANRGKRNEMFAFEEASDSDDGDRFAPARKTPVAARIAAAQQDPTLYLQGREQYTQHGSFIPNFKAASSLIQFPEYPPPKVPPDFVAFHEFSKAADAGPAATAAAAGAAGGGGFAPRGAAAAGGQDPVHVQRSELALAKAAATAATAGSSAAGMGSAYPPPPPAPTAGTGAAAAGAAAVAAPPEAPPPADAALARQIDGLAAQVVRSGQLVEDLARKQASSNNRYQFLLGGPGADYYQWRLHSLRAASDASKAKAAAAQAQQQQQQVQAGRQHGRPPFAGSAAAAAAAVGVPKGPRGPLTVEQRMVLLGETPLPATAAAAKEQQPPGAGGSADGSSRKMLGAVAATDQVKLASALNSAFVKGSMQDMGEAYQLQQQAMAGLRQPTKQPPQTAWQQQQLGVTIMDDSSTGAAAAGGGALTVSRVGASSEAAAAETAAVAAAAAAKAADLPVRSFEDWRPVPLLCKRFNVPDPYKGKAAPVEKSKFKSDFLALPDTAAAAAAVAAAEEERLMLEWQQQQQQQQPQQPPPAAAAAGAAGGGPVDATAFLDDLMQEVQQQEALGEAAEAAKAAAAKVAAAAAVEAGAGAGAGAGSAAAAAPGTQDGSAAAAAAPEGLTAAQGAAAGDGSGPSGTGAPAAAAAEEAEEEEDVLPVIDKPMDLFKAIFEDVTESEEEEDQEEEQQQQQQGQAAGAAGVGRLALVGADADDRGEQQQGGFGPPRKLGASDAPGAKGLAEAFMRRQERQPAGGLDPDWQRARQQQQQQPASQKEEILAALEALRSKTTGGRSGSSKQEKQKKRKKHKKEKQKKSKSSSKHASKSSKHKRSSSSKQHKKQRRDGSRDSYSSSDSGSDIDSRTDSGG